MEDAEYYVGLDWAAEVHAVCVLDGHGEVALSFPVAHSAEGIAALIARLARLGAPEEIPVGIERPNGRLVDLLLEAGHPVVPVSPNAIKTWRDGEVLSGAKSDAGDAAVIADYLRLRTHRLRVVPGYSSETKALRTVVRTRDDLVQMRIAATNQLAALLDAHWPGGKAIFADIESPIALAFLTRYPTAAAAAPPRRETAGHFLGQARLLRPTPPAQLLDRLRRAPAGTLDDTLTEAVRDAVLAMAAVLTALHGAERTSTGRWPPTSVSTRTGRSSRRCQGRVRSTPPRCSPSGAMSGKPTTLPTPWPPSPASPRSPRSRANTGRCTSAGPATNASAGPSPPSPTTAATPAPGPPRSTARPAPLARTIPTPSASWPAPGPASSGAAGTTGSPTTQTVIAALPRSPTPSSRHEVDIGSVMSGASRE